jgi:hypothetical protein
MTAAKKARDCTSFDFKGSIMRVYQYQPKEQRALYMEELLDKKSYEERKLREAQNG